MVREQTYLGNDRLKKETTEVIDDDGTFRQDVFFNATGTRYISAAFHAARKADPHAKLYANEFNIEGPGPKSSAYLKFIKALKEEGVPIDGLGIQSHLIVGQLPPNITETLEAFTKLGIEIALTELDIRMPLPATQEMIAQQRRDYETIVSACNALKRCIGVTVWDFTDKYSWIPGTFPGEGAACPWDEVCCRIRLRRTLRGPFLELRRKTRILWDHRRVWWRSLRVGVQLT